MGNLIFIGLGLYDEKGITLKGLETVKDCDILFMEAYTSTLSGATIEQLEALYGKKVTLLNREQVEDGSVILDKAKEGKVALLVPGDPMSATTHVDLRLRAENEGIATDIIHGTSALTAIPGLLGLQVYKFGKITTLPFWEGDYKPTSFMDVIKENFKRGLHSLILLDIREEEGRYMSATEAFRILRDADEDHLLTDRLVCVVARAGSPDLKVKAGQFEALAGKDFGKPMHSIVIPGELHFMEAEALVQLAGAPKAIK